MGMIPQFLFSHGGGGGGGGSGGVSGDHLSSGILHVKPEFIPALEWARGYTQETLESFSSSLGGKKGTMKLPPLENFSLPSPFNIAILGAQVLDTDHYQEPVFYLPHEATQVFHLEPFGRMNFGPISFIPHSQRAFQGSIFIRNNLTGLQLVTLTGVGGSANLVIQVDKKILYPGLGSTQFSNLTWNNNTAIFFQIPYNKACCSLDQQGYLFTTTLSPTTDSPQKKGCEYPISESKNFQIVNKGNLPITVISMSINNRRCSGFGFQIRGCSGFSLDPGETKSLYISFFPDFTSSFVKRSLKITTTNYGILSFPLAAKIPEDYLNPGCSMPQYVTDIEDLLQLLFTSFTIVIFLLFTGIFFRNFVLYRKPRNHPFFNTEIAAIFLPTACSSYSEEVDQDGSFFVLMEEEIKRRNKSLSEKEFLPKVSLDYYGDESVDYNDGNDNNIDIEPPFEKLMHEEIEKEEKEKLEKDSLEKKLKEQKEKQRLEKEKKERREKERVEKEKIEKERLEKERIEKEKIEKERLEKDRIEKERIEKERIEKERIEKERIERERIERERIEKERIERERIEKERREKERIEREREERIEKERKEKERIEKERLEKERKEKERIEKEREERREKERLTKEREERKLKERAEKEKRDRELKERQEKEKREKEEAMRKVKEEGRKQKEKEKERLFKEHREKIEKGREQERIDRERFLFQEHREKIEKGREQERIERERALEQKKFLPPHQEPHQERPLYFYPQELLSGFMDEQDLLEGVEDVEEEEEEEEEDEGNNQESRVPLWFNLSGSFGNPSSSGILGRTPPGGGIWQHPREPSYPTGQNTWFFGNNSLTAPFSTGGVLDELNQESEPLFTKNEKIVHNKKN